jgi:hypothetical protein
MQPKSIYPIIDSKQVEPAADCWGWGCCYNFDFKEWVLPRIARFISNFPVWPWSKGIRNIADFPVGSDSIGKINEDQQSRILIAGFGMPVFGTSYKDAFLDPENIKPKNIAFFIKQLAKTCEESKELTETNLDQLIHFLKGKKFLFYSASAGSFLALSSFLNKKQDEEKSNFFNEVVKDLFPQQDNNKELQNKVKDLIENMTKQAVLVNPPGIFYHAGLPRHFDLKTQAYGVGELVKETYFTNMIEAYLSHKVCLHLPKITHSSVVTKNYLDKVLAEIHVDQENLHTVFSSPCDEVVFPFYYVAMFAEKLKNPKYSLDDKQISKFVYKVMQYGDIVKKDGDESELDEFCKLAIDELGLSNNTHKDMFDVIAKKYLDIRNSYLALQKKYLQKEINEGVEINSKQVRKKFREEADEIFTSTKNKADEIFTSTKNKADEIFTSTKNKADEIFTFTKKSGDVDAMQPSFSPKKPYITPSVANPGDSTPCVNEGVKRHNKQVRENFCEKADKIFTFTKKKANEIFTFTKKGIFR